MSRYLLIFLSVFSLEAFSLVTAKNYDFSLKEFEAFTPGKRIADIPQRFGKAVQTFKNADFITFQYYVSHLRYKFVILVQTQNGIITDFHARLPNYFLHDVYLQSLHNKLGKQDTFYKENEAAIYIWKNKDNLKHIYSGACTITCFPIYYSVQGIEALANKSFKPLLNRLVDSQ